MPRKVRKTKNTFLPPAVHQFLQKSLKSATAIVLIGISFALILSLATFSSTDASLNTAGETVENILGPPGAMMADVLIQGLGLASILLVLVVFEWGMRLLTKTQMKYGALRVISLPITLALAAAALACLPLPASWPLNNSLGGFAGTLILDQVLRVVPIHAGYMLYGLSFLLFGMAFGLFLFSGGTTQREWNIFKAAFRKMLYITANALGWVLGKTLGKSIHYLKGRMPHNIHGKQPSKRGAVSTQKSTPATVERSEKQVKKSSRARQPQLALEATSDVFELPPTSLLQAVKNQKGETLSKDALEQNARLLESVLNDFGVRGEITKVHPGPVVTLYELEPAAGVKSARVIALADDIARSMSAISARVAVVPGKNAIGIELPNSQREIVYLRELLESSDYENISAKLPLVLGKDIGGGPIVVDLSKMPHLLVSGTTGSGKSVGINTMILSLLYRLPPDQLKLILIDPKMLELSVYDDIPHLLTPVVTDPKKSVVALKWCVREMENRYRAMSKLGVRNIAGYNQRVKEAQQKGEILSRRVQTGFDEETGKPVYEDQPLDLEPLPFIVVVADEMADLMMVAGKDIEAAVQRLAQMARAAGIHLIMSTQRPSVDVITGTIKANFPNRIGFQVTSKIDSRTILGEQGAEQLLGMGDMLYMAGGGRISRVHGPFVSDQEVEDVVKFFRRQGAPAFLESITQEDETEEGFGGLDGANGNSSGEDSLYDQAVDVVLRDGKVSISYVQRRLRIGYNKAATLIERMEEDGVISAPGSGGKREILARRPDEDNFAA